MSKPYKALLLVALAGMHSVWPSNHSIDSQSARSSSALAYYEPSRTHRSRACSERAVDISIVFDVGQLHTVFATREVLLCTGIGDKNVLDAHDIDVKLDLPGVEANLEPLAPPAIDHNILDNQVDVAIWVDTIKFACKITATPSLLISTAIMQEAIPGPTVQTDAEIEDFVCGAVATIYHPVGTAAMLPRNDGGVVDSSLKLYGTSNLRVINASILPIQQSAHIQAAQATVYAIAEKVILSLQN
ncbi:4-nitrobenzyl alcohol dehydrogenase-like protein [Mycena olivaceomarginata]|nr:4-nitrobenzyl alcohol dehydrogenase-like protein [Mycena olivaceomarginata]